MLALMLSGATLLAEAAPAEDPLVSMERQSWIAWQAQDDNFWRDFLSEDHVEMGYGGPASKASVIDAIKARICKVTSYKVSDFSVRHFSPDSAVVTYRAEQDTICGGVKVPTPVWASSFFAKRHGHWENVFYVHTPIAH
jgi:hypothetical protein